jgi:hypothetical protein
MVIFQLDVVHKWPNKWPLKSMDEKLSPFFAQTRVLSFISHKKALESGSIKGFSFKFGTM